MRFFQLIKRKLNINKSKEILKLTFEVIYYEFYIIFNDVARLKDDFILIFVTQRLNYNVRKRFSIKKTRRNNLKYNSSLSF